MISCIEIALKQELLDAEASSLKKKADSYFGIKIMSARCVHIVTIDADLDGAGLDRVKDEILTNPVTQISSLLPLDIAFDWCVWIGFRPGVKDNAGATAMEAISDVLGKRFGKDEGIYTSKRYCLKGETLTREKIETLAVELLSNPIIQQFKIFSIKEWNKKIGADVKPAKVILDHTPCCSTICIDSDEMLSQISDQRNLALNPRDIPVIRAYFLDPKVLKERREVGLSVPTDVELEYISQARSDHCNHNTFNGIFQYTDAFTNERVVENSLFKTYIQRPTLALKEEKDWVVSVLWDNAGVGKFDDDNNYVITGETHNSPSNMEAYGGAITGIVGVYRDPMGTGLGAKLFMGSFGFCVGEVGYDGPLNPPLHPRRLLDGVIEGVKDGGNKSGVPTTFGQTLFDPGYMGKSLVFVTALGIMPALIAGKPSHKKTTSPGELIIMSGGRVGKDGIHGVTASSESYSENTPAGHVQIGDPYTQKKMHDFLLICRDEGLTTFITDNGGGGLSSSVGESAMLSNGCEVWLDRVPLKYEGLDMWEIWISESQERMTIAVKPENLDRFMELSREHAVESTVIGKYTDTGKLHIKYKDETCAYVDMDLLEKGFPSWEFDAVWLPPETRGLTEPVISTPADFNRLLLEMLARPNICSKEWILRQYDHEVQGGSVIKPLVGVNHNIPSDASVTRPVLTSQKGLAFSQSLLPWYSKIDAYHMMACTIDEAVRRLICVGGSFDHIGGVDNFCWPNIGFDEKKNPDGKFKAAQLVRACRALKDTCMAYKIPLLSGKDSMYVDGHLEGQFGERVKVSALPTVQFSATSVLDDISKCVTMDPKVAGDLVYVMGTTQNELGASEYYDLFDKTGKNVPEVDFDACKILYKVLEKAIDKELIASSHAVARGGIGVHLCLMAMAGQLGMEIDLSCLPLANAFRGKGGLSDDILLFSESAGRFIVTISPDNKNVFEKLCKGLPVACVGSVTDAHTCLKIDGRDKKSIVNLSCDVLDKAFNKTFGDHI
ncbi:MAG: phosphoribosylformylglycinamidine synthase [Proteobacteria bacterium]|nr:phosphoribosylformylglycinamidine synthase [Desulfobacula sp.]MBU4131250.1 phosphoribosylformylglycinamidine synthase [Pseudomonadota bacterium]